ncbi:MAG: twin-arginine translocation pathway signal protein [Pseudomonas sp.]|nr:twin-arginine translocation pathway signal protein [Pseudomonas sp.]
MIKYLRMMAMISIFAITAGCHTGQSTSTSGAMPVDTEMDLESNAALKSLYTQTPQARALARRAEGILVFPDVVKAGLFAGAQHGEGELIENGKVTGYYSTTAASYGLQAGVQRFGYVMFFMSDSALHDLKTGTGFEVGVGPSIVVVDSGMAKSMTTSTVQSDIYAFIFDQKGLMAGLGLQGSKITRLSR